MAKSKNKNNKKRASGSRALAAANCATRSSQRNTVNTPSLSTPISDFSKTFESDNEDNAMPRPQRTEPGEVVAKNDARIEKAIGEVLERHPDTWVESTKALKDYVEKQRKGEKKLKTKLTTAVTDKCKAANRIADILARDPNLDPDNGEVFDDFKTRRLARLFIQKPEMLAYLKTVAETESYNKGWKEKAKLYDEIAEDPESMSLYVEDLCNTADKEGAFVEGSTCTYRETLDAMDWYADHKLKEISEVYEEWKDIPGKELFKVEKKPSNLV